MDCSLKHIAFIPDGNRRWAKQNGLPSLVGHKKGYEKTKEISLLLSKYGIEYVTYYIFSTENWERSEEEVSYLMNLFRDFFGFSGDFFKKNNMKFTAIGNLQKLPEDILKKIRKLEDETKDNSGTTITAAISYSSREEIVRASQKIATDISSNKIKINDITEDIFASYLDTAGIPYPDAIVRTSEKRISNFLLWQSAYSEIFFVNKYWPDFSENELEEIVKEFSERNRRYGK